MARSVSSSAPSQPHRLTVWPSVYSSNKAVLAENIGRRLENFFWRIWSSERLRQRLTGTQVNIHFDIINEGGYIRTTPTASPKSSKSLNVYYREARRRSPPTTPPLTEAPSETAVSTNERPPSGNDNVRVSPVTLTPSTVVPPSERLGDDGSSPSRRASRRSRSEKAASSLKGPSKAGNVSDYGSPEHSSVTPTPISPIAALEKTSKTSKENRRTSQSASRRPPILKKESSGSSRSSKSAKVCLPSSRDSQTGEAPEVDEAIYLGGDLSHTAQTKSSSTRRQTATRFNEEVAVSIPKPSSISRFSGERSTGLGGETSQKAGKRNLVVVASTAANKTKPTFVRQRSSASTSKDAPSRSSSNQNLARSPRFFSSSRDFAQSQDSSSSTEKSLTASPDSTKRHRESRPDPPLSEDLSEESYVNQETQNVMQPSEDRSNPSEDLSRKSSGKQTEGTKPLIDPDFRAKFIDRTRTSQRSLTDLSAFARKSAAAVPTSASYQATGMMGSLQASSSVGKGQGREAFTNMTAPLKAPAPAGPEAAGGDSPPPLPKTKSQLTLLLENEKARSAKEESSSKRPHS